MRGLLVIPGAVDFRKSDRTRETVFCLLGVALADEEGVWGILRRKSVRTSLVGTGSEMFPKEEPLLRLEDLRRPRQHTPRRARRVPIARPGKKPTRIASTGNLSQVLGMMVIGVLLEDAAELEDGLVDDEGLLEVAVASAPELVATDDVALLTAELC